MGVGVRAFCTGTIPTYTSYINKQSLYQVQLPLAQGDKVTARGSFGTGTFRFSFQDRSNPQASWHSRARCATTYGVRCSRASADVMAGVWAHGLDQPLSEFGRVVFHNVSIGDQHGARGSLARNRSWSVQRLDAYHGTIRTASSTRLTSHGTRFAARWRHS